MAKIAAALAIISAYIYLFGIMGTIESLDKNIPEEIKEETGEKEEAEPVETQAVTSAPVTSAKTDRVIYTYKTELNVLNGKKPSLVDYTATEALLIAGVEPPAAAAPVTTTPEEDFSFDEDDFDYTTPKRTTTTPLTTTTPEITSTTAATSLTSASTSIITAETTTTTAETTTTTAETTTTADTTTTAPAETTSETFEITTIETTESSDVTTLPPETEETTSGTDPLSWMDRVTDETTTEEATAAPETSVSQEMLTVNAGGTVVTDYAANIVAKAVMAEIGDSFHEEAIKAQAIATYTYIKYYNQNNQNAYVVFKTPSDRVTRCVNEVIGKAIRYDGEIIQAVYSASSAGYTAASVNVWGVDYPYLRSVKTEFDAVYDINYGRRATFTSEEIKNLIEDNTDITLSGDPSTWFEITSRIDGAFVGSMNICGQNYYNNGSKDIAITGRVFREIIMEYGIRSASFDILYDAESDSFIFTTYGYGHCVGMSQHGANILATQHGLKYNEILSFYYQGTTIS